jgi:hypothetical protein
MLVFLIALIEVFLIQRPVRITENRLISARIAAGTALEPRFAAFKIHRISEVI